jgi:hypothetical protein
MENIILGKAAFITPLYLSVVWALMISYQLFTQTAVTTVIGSIELYWPPIGTWLFSRIDMMVFIFSFAWVFVLSSVLPSVILGKNRSVLIQFLVVLTLTFASFIIQDGLLMIFEGETIAQILNLAHLFINPYIALGFLSLPYIFMLMLDLRSRRTRYVYKALGKEESLVRKEKKK